jgi:hypothetical protein
LQEILGISNLALVFLKGYQNHFGLKLGNKRIYNKYYKFLVIFWGMVLKMI